MSEQVRCHQDIGCSGEAIWQAYTPHEANEYGWATLGSEGYCLTCGKELRANGTEGPSAAVLEKALECQTRGRLRLEEWQNDMGRPGTERRCMFEQSVVKHVGIAIAKAWAYQEAQAGDEAATAAGKERD